MRRKETPVVAKIFAGVAVGYALSPIDLIPDFIPLLGYLDDIILLPLLIALALRFIPDPIMASCKVEAAAMWQEGKPKKWFYALPIIVFWGLLIGWATKRFIF